NSWRPSLRARRIALPPLRTASKASWRSSTWCASRAREGSTSGASAPRKPPRPGCRETRRSLDDDVALARNPAPFLVVGAHERGELGLARIDDLDSHAAVALPDRVVRKRLPQRRIEF